MVPRQVVQEVLRVEVAGLQVAAGPPWTLAFPLQLGPGWDRLGQQRTLLSDQDIGCCDRIVDNFAREWTTLQWSPNMWVRWAVAHSCMHMHNFRSRYMFSSIPTERTNQRFKTRLQNAMGGVDVDNAQIIPHRNGSCAKHGRS